MKSSPVYGRSVDCNDGVFFVDLSFHCTVGDRPKLNNLLEQVVEVFEWEQVGTALGVKKYKLSEIREARHGVTANCKLDLFDYWLRSDVRASWKKLIEALEKVEYFELARNLRAKHGLRREILHR